LEKDKDGRVVVRSPDLQGVVTDGANENEALQNAFEAVNAILETRGLPKEYNLTVSRRLSA
jgi:predicted RNase H-like HicB family nuclease